MKQWPWPKHIFLSKDEQFLSVQRYRVIVIVIGYISRMLRNAKKKIEKRGREESWSVEKTLTYTHNSCILRVFTASCQITCNIDEISNNGIISVTNTNGIETLDQQLQSRWNAILIYFNRLRARTTCHARRKFFIPKLQYFFNSKYNPGKTNDKFITSQWFLSNDIIPDEFKKKKKATNYCIQFGHSLWSAINCVVNPFHWLLVRGP